MLSYSVEMQFRGGYDAQKEPDDHSCGLHADPSLISDLSV